MGSEYFADDVKYYFGLVVNVIYNLRKKIEPDSKNPTYIKTVIGVGYKFELQRSVWHSVFFKVRE